MHGVNERYLLDTAIVGLLSHDDPTVRQKLAAPHEYFVPVFALAELEFGALYYQILHGTPKYINRYATFLAAHGGRLLYPDLDTSHIYAAVAALLKATGKPMQSNDIWIAALAQQHGLTVLTKDSDFRRVTGLAVEVM